MPLVTSGVEKGNLRELALARMDDLGLKCRDVRTREAGIQACLNMSILYVKKLTIHCYKTIYFVNFFDLLGYSPQNKA